MARLAAAGASPVFLAIAMFLATPMVLAIPVAGATADSAAVKRVTVDSATSNVRWTQGYVQPGASVVFSGHVTAAATTLTAVLRPLGRPGIVTKRQVFQVAGPGAFHARLRLPPRPLPGRYSLKVTATIGPATLAPITVGVAIPAPAEGVLDRVRVSAFPNGPWLLYTKNTPPHIQGSHKELWMQFRFLYPPSGKTVQLVWKLKWHTIVGKVTKRYKDILETSVASASPLPSGHWSAVLTIDGRVAKKMDVLVG
jgi:hypothetical protein